ncbi:MAG: hypothetical protein L0241_11385 [Planctomycetia bacterium]|nr:hypothetical protein [Planctomycetia bacterium]
MPSPLSQLDTTVTVAGENDPQLEAARPDSLLKNQVYELIQLLDDIGTGTIAVLTVKHGWLGYLSSLI